MVFPAAGSPENGDATETMSHQITDGFGLVVRLLVGIETDAVSKLLTGLSRQRIAIADNAPRLNVLQLTGIGRAITADQEIRLMEKMQRDCMHRKIAAAQYNRFGLKAET